jgi:RNA polymerase sigma factor for flagellar operon FliA
VDGVRRLEGGKVTVQDLAQAYRDVARQGRRDQLILDHLPLVRHIVGKLTAELPSGIDIENLEAAGVLGLVEAATSFDPEREVRFKTFAYIRVRGAILDELRRNCPLPQPMLEALAKVRKAYRTLPAPVSVAALALASGLSEDEVSDCLAASRLTRMVSLSPGSRDWTTRLDDEGRPEAPLERAEEARLLDEAIAALPERERLAVTLYYREDLRLKEISVVLSLSESRVSRILNAALFHLTEYFRGRA